MTRVIHTGDTHLGYQQYHVPERRRDFLAAFRQVVEDAVADDVDAVVHAGDLFHDRRPTLSDIMGTLDVLRNLDDADIPFLAVVGNHEAKRDAQWLDLFESLGLATRLGDDPEIIGDTAFYGLDFVPRSKRDDLAYSFEDHDADFAALVTHGLFQPFEHGNWDATEILDGAGVDFDAMLLGDDHVPDTAQVADTWLTYCGSTERASADEREDRGYNIVTFDDDVQISRRGLDTREFVFCEVELAEDEGVSRVREAVGQYDLTDAVVIVHVDGDGEPVTPASVEEFALDEGALVARVTDHRELADDREVEVNFADPDDAVRERVRELGLSEAARDIDETIRASKVAGSNVADEVESHVRELVADEDLSVFDAAPEPAGEEVEPGGEEAGAVVEGGDAPETDSETGASTAAEKVTTAAEADGGTETDGSSPEDSATDDSASPNESRPEPDASDGQSSMEEYL
ncbi:DNA repair exonuclease SbcCD nuclease subunit [Halomicrobium zhouii]|uniref:DNA double-strand break repair protein Mre11 n=1 Tax=Halomicrobium zhouii TaxID=767519 RepID=A0A1I6LDD7_9EURY|nr:DNA double-strand break repair protein Mre11 [Halomicrobium zhouii]SFS01288.1 DNA repair exonuclease SbcCD nuclease subunit [Halomicrobium zhouii]